MDASIRNVSAQESTLWQNIAGALFALAFIVFLITLTVASPGRATMLTGLLGMTGALLLVAVLRKVREFSIGPVAAKLWEKVTEHDNQLAEQRDQLARQQELINTLVRYSMSSSILSHLSGIACLCRYSYHHNEAFQREMYFLRDNGLIKPKHGEFADFDSKLDGKNLVEVVEPTPIGYDSVKLRSDEIHGWLRENPENVNEFGLTLMQRSRDSTWTGN